MWIGVGVVIVRGGEHDLVVLDDEVIGGAVWGV
jgi:hypothetical protein